MIIDTKIKETAQPRIRIARNKVRKTPHPLQQKMWIKEQELAVKSSARDKRINRRKEERMMAIFQRFYDRCVIEGVEAINDDLDSRLEPVYWKPGGADPFVEPRHLQLSGGEQHSVEETQKSNASFLVEQCKQSGPSKTLDKITALFDQGKFDEVATTMLEFDCARRQNAANKWRAAHGREWDDEKQAWKHPGTTGEGRRKEERNYLEECKVLPRIWDRLKTTSLSEPK